MVSLELVIVVDQNGDYGVGRDDADARRSYADDIGALEDCDGFLVYNLTLEVPEPVTTSVSASIAQGQKGPVVLTVK